MIIYVGIHSLKLLVIIKTSQNAQCQAPGAKPVQNRHIIHTTTKVYNIDKRGKSTVVWWMTQFRVNFLNLLAQLISSLLALVYALYIAE